MTTQEAPQGIAARIVWARKRKGLSQERLAELIGTSRRHMIRIEKGSHVPGVEFRQRIAVATGQDEEFFEVAASSPDEEAADFVLALDRLIERRLARAGAVA